MKLDNAEHGVAIMEAMSGSLAQIMDDAVDVLKDAVEGNPVSEVRARRLYLLAEIQKGIADLTEMAVEVDKEKLAMAGEWDLMSNIVKTMRQNEEALRGLYRQARPEQKN